MLVGQERVLCIAAVESAPHLTHDGNDRLARWRLGLNVCSTCPTHSILRMRKWHRRRFSLACEDLGMVDADASDFDERPPGARFGRRDFAVLKGLRSASLINHYGFHVVSPRLSLCVFVCLYFPSVTFPRWRRTPATQPSLCTLLPKIQGR